MMLMDGNGNYDAALGCLRATRTEVNEPRHKPTACLICRQVTNKACNRGMAWLRQPVSVHFTNRYLSASITIYENETEDLYWVESRHRLSGHIRAENPRDNEDLVVKSARALLEVSCLRLDAGTERSVRTDSVIRSYNSVRTDTFQPNPMC